MLTIIEEHGQARPIVLCDHCHERITSAADGNYQWKSGTHAPEMIYFTHKRCFAAFEKRAIRLDKELGLEPSSWGAMGLECLPVYMVRLLEMDYAEAEAIADLLALPLG